MFENLDGDDLDRLLGVLNQLSIRTPLDYMPYVDEAGQSPQLNFHKSDKKFRLFSGANQTGKTTAGANEALFHATGLYPDWYPQNKRILTPNRGRIIGEEFAKWDGKVLEPKLFEWLPKSLLTRPPKRTVKGALEEVFVRHVSGGESSFDIMTHEQDPDVFEGWTGHWVWFDEPPPKHIFNSCKRGLMFYKGRAWFTMTPIKEPWIYNDFILDKDPDVFCINVDIDQTPYLGKEEKESFARGMVEEERRARLHGQFRHLAGRVYQTFDETVHCVSEKDVKIESSWPVYFVIDPHPRKPAKALWARVDPFNRIYFIDELIFDGPIKELCKAILKREVVNKIDPNSVIRIGDPNQLHAPIPTERGLTFKLEFARYGVNIITEVNDDLDLGHLAVQGRLHWDRTKKISSTNLPSLYFVKEKVPSCIREMLMYVWDEYRGVTKDSKGEKETPKGANKCFPDCVRYIVMFNPGFYTDNEPDPSPAHNRETMTGYRR